MLMAGKYSLRQGRLLEQLPSPSGFALFGRRIGPQRRLELLARLNQSVADAQLGHEYSRRVRMWLDLLAQLAHENAQVMSVMHVDRAPNFLQQMLVGDDIARVLGEHL